jgi:sodium-dependent dicarboxylate transporter 2/3/5
MKKIKFEPFKVGFGLLVFIFVLLFPIFPEAPKANSMLAAAALMAIWWMTEALPLAATSLLPIAIFPLLSISSGSETASTFFNSTIFIFLGGFLIALAMQKWELHKRISLNIINIIGNSPIGIVSGFMLASWLLSMFISNVATTVMMLPIGIAVILKFEDQLKTSELIKFSAALMLGIAYSSSVGGITTLVGTAPNLAFQRIYMMNFPNGEVITFASWLKYGLPISIIMIIILWFVLNKIVFKVNSKISTENNVIKNELSALGKIKFEEIVVISILFLTGLLWLFRRSIEIGDLTIPGWSSFLSFGKLIDDGTVAIFMSLLFFIIPSKSNKNVKRILEADVIFKIPWDVILIFGGGFALAHGFSESGLSEVLGNKFIMLKGMNEFLIIAVIAFGITFLTELTSNTATTYTVLPILSAIAVSIDVDPMIMMLPATISASFAFMLPVATPPNAIVFGSGKVSINQMIKTGIILNLVGIMIVSIMIYILLKVF